MRIADVLGQPGPHFSFEFFPPKTNAGEQSLFRTITSLKEFEPSFVSVTCGAGGSTRRKTIEWARRIRDEIGIEPLVHMTCRGVGEGELSDSLGELASSELQNILALRGDHPLDEENAQDSACLFASDLISRVKTHLPQACVVAACYPETHTEATSRTSDLEFMKAKADAGAEVFITQLFFDNDKYFQFVGRARTMGITQPIIPGIMPIQNVEQIKRFTQMCGASIPKHLMTLLEQYKETSSAVFYIGVAHAIAQADELLRNGVPGLHFYTLNKSPATRLVVEALRNR
jgi:methylenetetrahydrofolate reductase (NADPH)